MIVRTWRGGTTQAKADEYLAYLQQTGVKDYTETQGNRGVLVLRRMREGTAEFPLISLWESSEVFRRFAGDDINQAVYYPKDKEYLLSFESHVEHYELLLDARSA